MDSTPGTPGKGFNPGSKMTQLERAELDRAIAKEKKNCARLERKLQELEGSLKSKDKHGTQRTRTVYSSPQSVPKQRPPATSHYLVPELPQGPLSLTSRSVSFPPDLQNVNRASPEDPLQRPPRVRTPTPDYPMADQAAAGLKSPVHRTPKSRSFDVLPDSAADNTAVERFLHRELELRTPDKNMPRESDHSVESTAVRRYLLKTLEHRVQARGAAGTSDSALSLEDSNNESAHQRASSPTPSSSAFQSEATYQSSRTLTRASDSDTSESDKQSEATHQSGATYQSSQTLTRASDSDTSEPEQQSRTRSSHQPPKSKDKAKANILVSSFILPPPKPMKAASIIKTFSQERAFLSTVVASIVRITPATKDQSNYYKTCLKLFFPLFAANLVIARSHMMSSLSKDRSPTSGDLHTLLDKMVALPIFTYRIDDFAQCDSTDIRKQIKAKVKHFLATNNMRALNILNASMHSDLQAIKSIVLQILEILNKPLEQQDDTSDSDSENLNPRTTKSWL